MFNNKHTAISLALALTLSAGSANAGVKDWLKKQNQQSNQPAAVEGTPVSPEEIRDCEKFMKAQKAGQVPLSVETGAKFERCKIVIAGPKTLETVQVQGTRDLNPAVDKGKALKSAGAGAVIGSVIGSMLGVDPRVGMAVGGAIGFGWSYKKQVKDARTVEAAAKSAGMDASVSTEQHVDEKGKKQEALASLTIRYEADDMEAMNENTRLMLDKLGAFTTKAKNTLTIRFDGGKACHIPLDVLRARGALDHHKVVNNCSQQVANQIVITPVPDIR